MLIVPTYSTLIPLHLKALLILIYKDANWGIIRAYRPFKQMRCRGDIQILNAVKGLLVYY